MLTALFLFLPLTLLLLLAELRLQDTAGASVIQNWLAMHLYLPLLRSAALVVFVFMAYPALFGLAQAAPIRVLLADGHYRFDQLINLLLLIALLLPMIPMLNRITGITLALQGMCVTALLASWMASDSNLTLTLLPDGLLLFRIAAVLLAARFAGMLLADEFFRLSRYRDLVMETARMFAQLPAVIIYAHFLGRQFGGA